MTHATRVRDQLRFENSAQLTAEEIQSHLDTYIALLNGVQGFFAARGDVSRYDFRQYVHHLELSTRYPGIQGIGFTRRMKPEERDEVIAEMQRQGLEDFAIWPDHPRPEYHSIIYLEPLDWRNQRAIGYDMFTNPTRRVAMEQARDTGRPAASGKVRLVQETDELTQAGFLIYLPVYEHGITPTTLAERRAQLLGFVYSPFRADDLLNEILPPTDAAVDIQVFDTVSTPERLLHDSRRFRDEPLELDVSPITMTFNVAGRTWILQMTPGPGFYTGNPLTLPMLTLLAGLTLSLLLYSATSSLAKARTAAERTADALRRTEEMRARRTSHMALRADVSMALTSPNDSTRNVLQSCAEAAVRHLRVAFVRIWTIHPDGTLLELQASAGLHTSLAGERARVRIGEMNVGRIARERAPRLVNDITDEPSMFDLRWAHEHGITAFAGLPLLVADRLVGVIALFSREALAEDALDAVYGVADLLAQGIERKRAEEALRASEERFRATFNQAAAGIALTNPEGRFEQVNGRFCEIVGGTPEELLGKTWLDLIHPDDHAHHTRLYNRLLAGEINTFSVEHRFLCKGGRMAWASMSMSAVLDPFGRPQHTISVVRDVTARKRAEQTVLEQKRELEDFVSIVAHDLKHPVVSVQGLLGLLRQDAFQLLDDESRENLDMALSECRRMKDIISQLGHIVRIGSTEVRLERVHLRGFLEEALRRFSRTIEDKKVDATLSAPDAWAMIPRIHIDEVLDNLLDNALQYGSVSDEPRLRLRCTATDNEITISVQDNGPGIDPRFHGRIFEMFRRLDPGGLVQGTGVGLTSVQRLVKRIGGAITLDSEPGKGATFTIRFPAQILNGESGQ